MGYYSKAGIFSLGREKLLYQASGVKKGGLDSFLVSERRGRKIVE